MICQQIINTGADDLTIQPKVLRTCSKCRGRPAVSDRCLEKLNELLWICGVGPRGRHHLARPQEGHLQSHGVVVEDKHLVLLFPQILQSHLEEGGSVCSGEQEVINREDAVDQNIMSVDIIIDNKFR